MLDETVGGVEPSPVSASCLVVLVGGLPRELGAGRSAARAIGGIEEAGEGSEDDLSIRTALEWVVRFLDEIEEVVAPGVDLDDRVERLQQHRSEQFLWQDRRSPDRSEERGEISLQCRQRLVREPQIARSG